MSNAGSSGFRGLPPTVGVVRRKPEIKKAAVNEDSTLQSQDSVALRIQVLLTGKTIEHVEIKDRYLVLVFTNGESFSIENSIGWGSLAVK